MSKLPHTQAFSNSYESLNCSCPLWVEGWKIYLCSCCTDLGIQEDETTKSNDLPLSQSNMVVIISPPSCTVWTISRILTKEYLFQNFLLYIVSGLADSSLEGKLVGAIIGSRIPSLKPLSLLASVLNILLSVNNYLVQTLTHNPGYQLNICVPLSDSLPSSFLK